MEEQAKLMFLSMHKDVQKNLLRAALEQNNINMFFQLSKVLLDAPFSEGGMASEDIELISDQHYSK